MNYFSDVLLIALWVSLTTLLCQVPYFFVNQKVADDLSKQRKVLSKELRTVKSDSDDWDIIQKKIIATNLKILKILGIPIIIQFVIYVYSLKYYLSIRVAFLWPIWYIGFGFLFSKIWKKIFFR